LILRLILVALTVGRFIVRTSSRLSVALFNKIKKPIRFLWRVLVVKPSEYAWSSRRYRQQLMHNLLPFKLMHQPWLPILFITIVAGLVLVNNIRISQVNAGDFGQHSLLIAIVQGEFDAVTEDDFMNLSDINYLIEETDLSLRSQIETLNNNQEIEPATTDEGSTLIKPNLVITARGARQKAEDYIVETGDTLSSIAANFGVSLATLLWENRLTERNILRIGQKLTILPTSGVSHRIAKGDTLSRIASRYGVTVDKIKEFNNIEGALVVGQVVIIPGGKPYVVPAPPSTATTKTLLTNLAPSTLDTGTRLMWPTPTRRITQYFSWRHAGLDLASSTGTPIYAAEEGVVQAAGWNRGGYGYYVIIDHGQGLRTLYGHASKLLVSAGERVPRGQMIALIGSTGRSTGPHLHFEVIVQGQRVNPLNYIR